MTPYQPEIRFADIDAMGHVNNAVYFSYFEQARIHFFRQMIGAKWDWKSDGLLVAHNEIDYKLPILLNDKVQIIVGCNRIGEKSFTVTYTIVRGEEICATGASVLVCFNHKQQQTQAVPPIWREALEKLVQK
jgi:acyl-CoA thioester hydrolase